MAKTKLAGIRLSILSNRSISIIQCILDEVVDMKNDIKTHLLRYLICVPFAVAGVVFRPFWHSGWGVVTLLLTFWVAMSLAAGWGGRGRPYSLRFGVIVSTALSLCFVTAGLVNKYAGIGLFCVLLYVAIKSRFLENRSRELDPDTGGKQSRIIDPRQRTR